MGVQVIEVLKFTEWHKQWRSGNFWQGWPTAYHGTIEKMEVPQLWVKASPLS